MTVVSIGDLNLHLYQLSELNSYLTTERSGPETIRPFGAWSCLRVLFSPRFKAELRSQPGIYLTSPFVARLFRPLGKYRIQGIKGPKLPTVRPFDFAIKALNCASAGSMVVVIVGGSPKELAAMDQRVRWTFPGLRLLGRHPGKVPAHFEVSVVESIAKVHPKLILLGGKLRRGSFWTRYWRERLPAALIIPMERDFRLFDGKHPRQNSAREALLRDEMRSFPFKPLRLFLLWIPLLLLFFGRVLRSDHFVKPV